MVRIHENDRERYIYPGAPPRGGRLNIRDESPPGARGPGRDSCEELRRCEAKIPKAHGGCLGTGSRRRTWQAAISRGEAHTAFDPRISEWGNPGGVMPAHPRLNQIGREEATRGTETSKYPEEEKSTEIPPVVASERGPRANRRSGNRRRGCGAGHRAVRNRRGSGTAWEGRRHRVRAPYANPRRLPTGTRVLPDT